MENLSIILVSPQGDANIGASARAMKNFGFADLRLVNPTTHQTETSYSWAVDAKDLVDNAKIYRTLNDAVKDRSHTVAFTRRLGRSRKKHMYLTEAATWIANLLDTAEVAIIFGREDRGLSNEEINLVDAIVSIPTSVELPSLNLAQAVLITCYEISKNLKGDNHNPSDNRTLSYVSKEEISSVLNKLDEALTSLKYEDVRDHPLKSRILNQFNKLFGRAGLTNKDINMLSGLLSRIDKLASSK